MSYESLFSNIPVVSMSKHKGNADFGINGDFMTENGGIRHILIPLPCYEGEDAIATYKDGEFQYVIGRDGTSNFGSAKGLRNILVDYTGNLRCVIIGDTVYPLFDISPTKPAVSFNSPLAQREWFKRRGLPMRYKVAKAATSHLWSMREKLDIVVHRNEWPKGYYAMPGMNASVRLAQVERSVFSMKRTVNELLTEEGVGAVLCFPNRFDMESGFNPNNPSKSSAVIVTA